MIWRGKRHLPHLSHVEWPLPLNMCARVCLPPPLAKKVPRLLTSSSKTVHGSSKACGEHERLLSVSMTLSTLQVTGHIPAQRSATRSQHNISGLSTLGCGHPSPLPCRGRRACYQASCTTYRSACRRKRVLPRASPQVPLCLRSLSILLQATQRQQAHHHPVSSSLAVLSSRRSVKCRALELYSGTPPTNSRCLTQISTGSWSSTPPLDHLSGTGGWSKG